MENTISRGHGLPTTTRPPAKAHKRAGRLHALIDLGARQALNEGATVRAGLVGVPHSQTCSDTLPCLNSDISTERPRKTSPKPLKTLGCSLSPPSSLTTPPIGSISFDPLGELRADIGELIESQTLKSFKTISMQHKRTAFILGESVHDLASRFGIENLGFLTLTFAEHILCPKEAQKRLNSLITHVIKPRYLSYLGVFERQKSGRIHYHMLVVLNDDIRTDFDFDQAKSGIYKSASKPLRDEWSFWRKTAKKYKFGRTELMPIKSTSAAISKYVGKYISKHMDNRLHDDKGVRLVRYAKNARAGTSRFQFLSTGSKEWRRKVAKFAAGVSSITGLPITDTDDLAKVAGKKWAFVYGPMIATLK